ncbi:MAG: hypothetical protein L3K06_05080, partial [Thermoplasmata archaeon]|nr:hypothetical protein [Thermoplasmata archaeon]
LAPTWVEALTLTPPSGGVLGNAEVRVSSPGGTVLKLADEPFGSMLTIALPTGVYTISASAPASPYGVATNASATTTVSLLSGNAATHLTLDYQFTRTASIVLTAPTSAALGNGGMATFSYVVTNTGNAPEVLHFTGSPSTFNFTFAPSNVSLGTAGGNRSVGGEVTIRVPVGTIVDHPTVTFEALLPNGQPAGFATPTPSISLTPYYALSLGGGAASSSSVSPYSASLAFYVRNPGTATEFVRMSVADATRLAGLGWTSKILEGKTEIFSPISLAPGANDSFFLQLVSPSAQATPPGTASVFAIGLNGSAPTSTLVITIPSLSLGLNQSSLLVTGPSVGSPPSTPDWLIPVLVFSPSIALVAILVARRYLKTRRWSRR